MKLRINPLAYQDLLEIKSYIAIELLNPEAADDIVRNIIAAYNRLSDFPFMGQSLSAIIGITTDYRYLVSGSYIIFYKIENEFVSVYRVLYGKRDYVRVLFSNQLSNEFDE